MKIKDIVNRSHVNLQNCDQEPIHIPGSVQPHGFLLALDVTNLQIKFCSGNVHLYTGATHGQLLEKNISDLTDEATVKKLRTLAADEGSRVITVSFALLGHSFEFICHRSNRYLILEAEKPGTETDSPDLVELSRDFVRSMEETSTLQELCNLVAVNIRKVTGYDRVMVYRFDEQYNGEVFAESKREDLESFYGLHYPHTDIPVQARMLYMKNQLRMITDVNYLPVPIYTTSDAGSEELDLGISVLRSVSPIHIQYLQNMGVGATLTISLLLRGKLWGLIACHHYSEKHLSYNVRMSAKLLGHFITSQIDARRVNEEYEIAGKTSKAMERVVTRNYGTTRESLQHMANDPDLLAVCNAAAVTIVIDGIIYKSVNAPSDKDILELDNYLVKNRLLFYHTDALQKNVSELSHVCTGFPGISFAYIDHAVGGSVIWFRKESVHEVNWAGDPSKAIEKDKGGLSPRKSFERWVETVKHHSKPWLSAELDAGRNFAHALEKHIHSILIAEEESKQREMAQALKKSNEELENINWISTHDLQEPLRKIQVMASMLLEDEKEQFSNEVTEKIGKMNAFAGRMQGLIKDILKYTKLNYNSETLTGTDLKQLLKELKAEWSENLNEANITLESGNLPVVPGIPFLVKQLFYNLISNSIKFKQNDRPGKIIIKTTEEPLSRPSDMKGGLSDYQVIEYSDNGIGFEQAHNENIFRIFSRLHNAQEYEGSGIGLALCRKIMATNKGYITAYGKSGEGATFYLFFLKKQDD